MIVRLGYVSITNTLDVTSSSSLTYTLYKKLGERRGNEKLKKVIDSNFESLKEILYYNIKNDISFYRMTSNLIPLATHNEVNYDVFLNHSNNFKEIGNIIKDNNIRLDIHLDPFCVLNSIKEDVVNNTINILKFYQNMFDSMKIKSKMIIHIGSAIYGKKASLNRFVSGFSKLNKNIQDTLIVENDDKTFNIINTLKLCQFLNIPMVLDYHHYICNHSNEKLLDYIDDIFKTWKDEIPKIHFSSPRSKKEKKAHHEYIDADEFIKFIESIKDKVKQVDVMLEAKGKDEALFRLIRLIKYKTNYEFINSTTFIVK